MPCLPCEKALICGEESRSKLGYISEIFKAIQENRIKNIFSKAEEIAIINNLADVERLTDSIYRGMLAKINQELGEDYVYPKE